MMKHKPLVSVITIFLNAERFIQEAIESVFAQTYNTWELLLIDDGSTDRSTDIALQYANNYPEKVRYLEHDGHKNRGMSASRNLGFRNSKGKYVALLDADDVWLPHKLEQQVDILESQIEAGMVYGATFYWYSWSGKPEDFTRDYVPEFGFKPNTLFKPPRLLTLAYPLGKAYAPCPSDLIFCRDVIDQIGGFEESFQGIYQLYEDQAFLAKVYLKIPVYVSSECWAKYRLHPDSCVSVVTKAGRYHKVRFYFLNWLEKYLSKQGVKDAMIWKALQHSLWSYRHPILSRLYPILQRLHPFMYHLLGHNRLHIIHGLKRKTAVNTSKIQVFSMNNLTGLQPAYEGYHDGANCNMISGWVWDSNNADIPIKVDILADNVLVDTIAAEEFRKDLFNAGKGNGHHAFNYSTPNWLKDGRSHTILIKVAGTDFNLNSTPKQIKCEFQIISDIRRLKAKLRSPVLKMRAILTKWIDKEYCPPVGQVRFGNLRRVTPISRVWGTDRGCPVDRYYIENFLACHADDIKGRVLEIGNNHYTRQFGRNRVTQSDVLNLLEEPGTTIVADITNAPHIPSNTFNCIIFTQTLQLIYDVRAAIQTLYRILKPGGVLLATLSGISPTYDRDWGEYWCWNFTGLTSRRLFEEVFAAADVSVEAYGNVLTAISFLHGLAAEELSKKELDYRDPGYDVSITVRAVKPKVNVQASPQYDSKRYPMVNLVKPMQDTFEILRHAPGHHKVLWLETHCKAIWYKLSRKTTLQKKSWHRFLHKEMWFRGVLNEIKWWEEWLVSEEGRKWIKNVQDPQWLLQVQAIIDRLHLISDKSISILDVGAGPVTQLGYKYPGRVLKITAIDPLATAYNRILKKANIIPPVPTSFCHGEDLLKKFEPESFDIAFANNSLDHSYDPVLIIKNMLTVVKRSRYVVLRHYRNEALTTNYVGLHQWNFDIKENNFIIYDKSSIHNITHLLSQEANVECYYENTINYSDLVVCVIQKI